MASPVSPNDLTRQQLDELDSLLQRMLSLPLTTPVGGPTTPLPAPPLPSAISGAWRSDAAAPTRVPYFPGDPALVPLTPAQPTLAALLRAPEAPPATWGPDPLARHTPLESPRLLAPPEPAPSAGSAFQYPVTTGTVRGVDAPALPAGYRSPEKSAPVAPMPAPVAIPESPPVVETKSRPIPLPLWPVFGVNWILEAILGLLGPLGTFLTHPIVKHLLGWVGLGLVVAAGVWAARGHGWIALPWPR